MDKSEIFELVDRFESSDLTVFEYEDDEMHIRLEKGALPAETSYTHASPPSSAALSDSGSGAAFSSDKGRHGTANDGVSTVKSPLVGVFYRAASPGAEPFVEVGYEISKGDVMCVIEAMKVMNEIKAPYDLKVVKALAADGDMVDCGKVLFEVEKC